MEQQFQNNDTVRVIKTGEIRIVKNCYPAANKFAVQLGNDGGNVLVLAPEELELVEKAREPGDTGPGFSPARSIMH